MDTMNSLSRSSPDETQLLPSCDVELDGTQIELTQSFGSIRSEFLPFSNNDELLVFPFESSQVHPDATQDELSHPFGFRSVHSDFFSFSNDEDLLVFPITSEISTSGVNDPGVQFACSSTSLVSSAVYPWDSVPDCADTETISKGGGTCPSQLLGVPTGSTHSLAVAPQVGIPSTTYKGLVPPSSRIDSSKTPFFTAYDQDNHHDSLCVPSLLQNSVAPNPAEMTIESAGPFLRRQFQVECTDHEAIQSGTTCLQCNDSFKSISELGHHATELQHDAFKCTCGQTFKRLDSLERHKTKYQPGARQYSCQLCDRYEGEKAFTREDSLKQHLRVYHRVISTKYGEYKKRYLKA